MSATERLRVLHDFYRAGEEADFHFDAHDMIKKCYDFRDYICPDSIEKNSDHVIFLKDYASYIRDIMVTELTDFNRNMCLCSTCADNFRSTSAYSLRRTNPHQTEKDTCTYCNQRTGYDFEIIPKNI